MHPPDLGERGEGWVAAQLGLMAAVVAAGRIGRWPPGQARAARRAGALLALTGVATAVSAQRALGSSVTMLPRPRPGGELVTRGPYRFVRHPMYAAGILVGAGYGLLRTSPGSLLLTGALAALWNGKSRVEERWLERHYPGYAGYRARTPGRFVPRPLRRRRAGTGARTGS